MQSSSSMGNLRSSSSVSATAAVPVPELPTTTTSSRPGSPKSTHYTFAGVKCSTYITVVTSLLLVTLVGEWLSISSRSTPRQHKRLGWNDSRQLRMQANSQMIGQMEAAAAAASSSSSSSSSAGARLGSQQVYGVKFTNVFGHLGATPNVQNFKPSISGHMQKKGHLAWEHWSTRKAEPRFDHFLSWRMNRTIQGRQALTRDSYTCKGADHPQLPFPGCHVFINHKYKYIYIRSPKAASTSIVDELGECTNTRTRGHNASTCMGMHSTWEFWYKDTKNITDMWHDYFVFGFIRNPWNRAYSLYKYMQSDGCMAGNQLLRQACQVSWGDFCADPWGTSDRVYDSGCLMRSKSYMYFHMMDQLHCMVTAEGDWAVDFVGRVEETNEDWKEVVKELNKRRDPSVPEIPYRELVAKNVRNGTVSDPFSGDNGHCLDAVSSWYACDIEKFGYLSSSRKE